MLLLQPCEQQLLKHGPLHELARRPTRTTCHLALPHDQPSSDSGHWTLDAGHNAGGGSGALSRMAADVAHESKKTHSNREQESRVMDFIRQQFGLGWLGHGWAELVLAGLASTTFSAPCRGNGNVVTPRRILRHRSVQHQALDGQASLNPKLTACLPCAMHSQTSLLCATRDAGRPGIAQLKPVASRCAAAPGWP